MSEIKKIKALKSLFYPENVAIYEAKKKISYFIQGFKRQGFDLNKLYLINPNEAELFSMKCYDSLADVPEEYIDYLRDKARDSE